MNIKLQPPKLTEMRPRLTVIGVGGAGGNAINNMIASGLTGVEFVAANTDAQALAASSAEHRIQLGVNLTEGLGAGSKPEIGEAAAEEAIDEIKATISGSHMVFIAAGMGGGTGTGASAVVARIAKELGVLAVAIVTKPFQFEGARRMRVADAGLADLKKHVDTLIVIPNQNLFRIAGPKTTFAEAFVLADQVLYAGIACIVDLIIKEGLINLDFADIRTVLTGMGTAMMGTGEAEGDRRATRAAEEAITNPLLDDVTLKGAKGVVLSIIGGRNMTLFEVDEAASRVRKEIDQDANIILGATFDESLGDRIRVSIVASGMSVQAAAALQAAAQLSAPAAGPAVPANAAQPAVSSSPPAPPVAARPAGVPPSASVSQGTVPQGPGPQRGPTPPPLPPSAVRPSESDLDADSLARALSEAMRSSGRPSVVSVGSAQAEPPVDENAAWKAPGDVVVRPGLVSFGHQQSEQPAPRPLNEPSAPQRYDAAAFAPQPPAEMRRAPSRVPPIDEFPQVGQHEYRVKSSQYGETQPTASEEPSKPQGGTDERRRGWFSRINFGKRADEHSAVSSVNDSSRTNDASRQGASPARSQLPQSASTSQSQPAQPAELPQFFGAKSNR